MRKSLKMFAVAVLMISLGAVGVFAAEPAESSPAESSPAQGVLNINTADAAQFALLPRIGVKAGERIVQYRSEHGPFKKVTDLMQVKGIGDKTFALISSYLVVEGKTTLLSEVRAPRKPRASRKASNTAQ